MMSPETALHILGLTGAPTRAQIDDARRIMLAALHPDVHVGRSQHVFERLCSEINEAHGLLVADSIQRRLRDDETLEQSLFQVNASAQWTHALSNRGTSLAAFDRQYAKDKVVAVAVLGLDPRFSWVNTNGWSGAQSAHIGTALYILVWNRTRRRVESLDISEGLLVDDQGNQYSSEGSFYWTEDGGTFNKHSSTLVPNAKLDGFLLYPALRSGASAYVRWYLSDTIQIGEKYITAEYDVALPREPQERALLLAALAPTENNEDDLDDLPDLDDEDAEDDVELDDNWLYGDK